MFKLSRLIPLLALGGVLHAAELASLVKKLDSTIGSERPMGYMRRIWETDRWFTFPKFRQTTEYIAATLRSNGIDDVKIGAGPADGVSRSGHWTMPLAWNVRKAKLEIVDPAVPPDDKVLADFDTVPASIGMWSGPTPPGGITAEVVWLAKDSPDVVVAAPLKGKLLLTNRNAASLKSALVKAGALGAINGFTENESLQNDRQWVNAWGDKGWAFNSGDTPLLSFSVTPAQSSLLRRLLAEHGRVRVRAVVDSYYYKGEYPYVTASIRGTGTEEVLTLGHVAEQGAHDNATGVAAMMEAISTLHKLIVRGELPRPKRTIRMLAMGEMYGSAHYVAVNRDRIRRTIAAMCLDTPAAPYELEGTEYTWHLNPHAASTFVDSFVLRVVQEYYGSRRPYHEAPYKPGTDTWLADPAVGVPTVWPYSGTGVHSHHNSADRPETVDPRSLRDLAVINAAFLYYLASAGREEAEWLASQASRRAYIQIDKAAESGDRAKVEYAVERGRAAIRSAERIDRTARLEGLVEQLERYAQPKKPAEPAPASKQDPEASKLVVVREGFGLIPLDEIPDDRREGQPSGAWAVLPQTALFWCDGKRTLAEVIRLTVLELGPKKFDYVAYFRFLAKHGYVKLKSISQSNPRATVEH